MKAFVFGFLVVVSGSFSREMRSRDMLMGIKLCKVNIIRLQQTHLVQFLELQFKIVKLSCFY